jgi:class 3 adenylate cyclase
VDDALERRIVTVLFADLVGFTTLSENLDAEDVAAIQDRYFAAVRDTIGRYGGQLEKFIGDAAMAVFGVPVARDDDAERAVRAGLALIGAVQQLGAALSLDDDVLQLRVGINTGETVVAASGVNEGRVTGDTVNTAARFQTAAPPGGVMIGESTALSVAGVAELGEQQRLELKGKAEPVAARLVTGLQAESSREQAMGALKAPTVGREAELAELAQAIERTSGGESERWLVVAPPGVGKSRLMREISMRAADSGAAVWSTRSRAGSVSPFETVAGLLAAALGEGGTSALRAALRAHGVVPARVEVIAQAFEGAGGATDDRDTLFAAWLDGLDALAGERAQVWLVEDIHWAGGDVLAFLDRAASRPAPHGRLIVATARPSLLDSNPEWSADEGDSHVLRLATLPTGDASQLIGALVGDALPAALVQRIAERSDGNCLFIEELLRTWVSVGTLVRDGSADAGVAGNAWRLAVPAEEVPQPQSVQAIYAAQLDDLPPDARRVARRASVAGRRFPVAALEPLEVSDSGLDPLRRRELVTGPVDEPLLGDAYSYRHALLRDAGYASLARAERARLHARLARWLEQAAGERSNEVAEQIGAHYAAALESAPALSANVDEGLDRTEVRALAARWYERAGQSALTLSARDAARQLLSRSIELTAESDQLDLARRWERLGNATANAADMSAGGAAYEHAIDLYRACANTAGVARATAALAKVWYEQLRFADSRDLADKVLHEYDELHPTSRARLLVARAMGSLGAGGGSAQIEADLEEAVAQAEAGDSDKVRLLTKQSLLVMRTEIGLGTAAEWSEIAEAARAAGDVTAAISATTNAAMYTLDDAPRQATATLEPVRELAIAHGLTEDISWIDYLEAEEAFASGDWDLALQLGSKVMDVGIANDYLRLTVRTIHVLVPIAFVRGEIEVLRRCQDWYAGLEVKAFAFPDSPYARIVRPAQDLDLAAAGLRAGYLPDPELTIPSFSDDASGPSWNSALDRIVRAWVDAGELTAVDRALDTMAEALAGVATPFHLSVGNLHLMRGRVAAARGDTSAAVTNATESLAHFRISDAPWWKAKALRLMQRVEAADSALVAEVEQIERALGGAGPTA